jgi:hypothetical protein
MDESDHSFFDFPTFIKKPMDPIGQRVVEADLPADQRPDDGRVLHPGR